MSSPYSSFRSDDEIFSATSGSSGTVDDARPSSSGSARPSPATTTTTATAPSALVCTLKGLASFETQPPRIEDDVSFDLPGPQYDTLLEVLYEAPAWPLSDEQRLWCKKAVEQAFPDPQTREAERRNCGRWLARHRWDYREPRLTFRMPSPIHDRAAQQLGKYIAGKLQRALQGLDRCLEYGLHEITFDDSRNKAEPDLCFWLGQGDDQSEDSSLDEARLEESLLENEKAEPSRVREFPGLVVEVGWSHPTSHEQCVEYIAKGKGNTRCVISLDATYIPPHEQETTPVLPEIVLNAWRFIPPGNNDQNPDHQLLGGAPVQHFIQNQTIWRYSSGPPRSVHCPHGAIELTLGDLSSNLRNTATEPIRLRWHKLSSIFRDAYLRNRGRQTLKRTNATDDYDAAPQARRRLDETES